jgi:hypothetical protein
MLLLPGVTEVASLPSDDGKARFRVQGDGRTRILEHVGRLAADNRWTLVELTPERRDLEDIFRSLATHHRGAAAKEAATT